MSNIKTRALAILLAVCMLAAMFPAMSVFAADEFTVTFSVPEGVTPPEAMTGTSITLPTAATPNGKYRFAGWSVAQGTVEAPAILTGSYAPATDVILYAVYSLSNDFDGYVKVTEAPDSWEGEYLIVCESQGLAFNSSFATTLTNLNKTGNYLSVDIDTEKHQIDASSDLDNAVVTFEKSGDNYTLKTKKGLAFGSSGKSSGSINAGADNPSTVNLAADGTIEIANVNGTTYNFTYNITTTSRFAFWATKSAKKSCLYEKNKVETVYTTAPAVCEHTDKTSDVTEATCTEAGCTTYTCPDCTLVWTADYVDARGHDLIADTESEPVGGSYRRFACTRCDYAENRYQIILSICGEAGESQTVTDVEGMELPKAVDVPQIDGYTFGGWSTAELAEPSADAVILNGHYTPTADLTLYAAYYYTEANTGDGTYVKVTVDDKIVNSGKYLFVNDDNAVAFNGNASDITKAGNFLSGIEITENTIASTEDLDQAAVTIVPIADSENYAMILNNGKYVGHTGTSAAISSRGESYGPYPTAITFDEDGNIVVCDAAQPKYELKYNATEGSEVFKFYSSTNKNYLPVSLYYKNGSGVTAYYITNLTDCDHSEAASEHIEATCTAAGFNHFTCPDCGFEWDEIILNEDETVAEPALGHNLEGAAATCNNDGTHTRVCSRCTESVTENCVYDNETHLCTICEYPQPYVTVTFNDIGTLSEEKVYDSVTLPEGMGADGYDFAGWTEIRLTEETADRPELVGSKWLPKADTTLYAVYVRTERPAEGTGDYIKITDNDELTEGKYLIVAEDVGYAFNGALDEPYVKFNYYTVSVLDDTIASSYANDCAAVTIAPMEASEYFSMKSSNGAFLGSTGSGNSFNHNKNNPYPTAIDVNEGIAVMNETVIKENAEGVDTVYTLCYNAYGSSDRFAFYDLGGKTVKKSDISLFKKDGECTYYYATDLAVDLKIKSAALRMDEDIDVVYTATVPAGYTDVKMTFTMNGESVDVPDDGSHTFVFEGVTPQCIGDNISATLIATVDDEQVSDDLPEYSIRTYCVNQLAKDNISASLRTLLSDLLAYGAAAQTYMGYNTEALATSDEDITNPTYSTYAELSDLGADFEGTAASDLYWVSAGLTLKNSVAMRFRFYAASVDGLTVNVTINGRTQSFTASDFTAVEGKTDIYEISFTGIKATEFGSPVTASFSAGGNTVSYSVNTYICAKQADADANLAALVKALYCYGASAAAYAG